MSTDDVQGYRNLVSSVMALQIQVHEQPGALLWQLDCFTMYHAWNQFAQPTYLHMNTNEDLNEWFVADCNGSREVHSSHAGTS